MKKYIVQSWDTEGNESYFTCYADDAEHAKEQAQDADPNDVFHKVFEEVE